MNRRDVMKGLALGSTAGSSILFGGRDEAVAQRYSKTTRGLPPVKITNVKAISTAPDRVRLTVVKVDTSEPGLYGLGCATYQQRPLAVESAVNDYLNPFCKGKDVDNIEDMWQTAYVSSYWRNGPVLNNAMSGVDQALWDIKGKRASMPVYQLLGGKCRFAINCYISCGGRSLEELADGVQKLIDRGYRVAKVQIGGMSAPRDEPDYKKARFGLETDGYMDPGRYKRIVPKMFEHIRTTCGDEVELLHDMVYQRIHPIDAINLVKELEQYRPFFIEDPFGPEDNSYFRILRQQTSCPIAMGEMFNNPHEWVSLITERLIDFIRIHVSQIGGITPAMKIARLCEYFNVRTAFHGPNDVSPVGHAAQGHMDLAVWNFGIQEFRNRSEQVHDVFPGTPEFRKDKDGNGYMYVNEAPGLGVTINEKEAAKYPISDDPMYNNWTQTRHRDGTAKRR
ncbi:enolase C-terminal domain-like protein [Candidatus Latescibacterota bacterium]